MWKKINNFLNSLDEFFVGKKTIFGILAVAILFILKWKGIESPQVVWEIAFLLLGFGVGYKKGRNRR